jgi:tRNA A-37 threonylcarbamoyl transferase component Bud32
LWVASLKTGRKKCYIEVVGRFWPAVTCGFGVMRAILNPPTALDDILHHALREPSVRVRPILGPYGERLWLKRIEALPARWRLQKSDRRRAFDNEVQGLHILGNAGLSVPAILAEGPDHIVISDVGPTLQYLLRASAVLQTRRAAAFRAAGTALGRLHKAGFAHGRPAIRDICWDGGDAYFIDLERFSPQKASARKQAIDVVFFLQTYFCEVGKIGPEIDAAMMAYRAAAPKGAWGHVRSLGAWLSPLLPLVAPVRWVMPQGREFQAFPKMIGYVRRAVD